VEKRFLRRRGLRGRDKLTKLEGRIMLLRRVMKHVKDQNWTTVALDFMIVVVGVFIGI
jgi:hypothetical protein